MRTVLLLSTMCLCTAINPEWQPKGDSAVVLGISTAFFIFMDIVEFVNKNQKK